MLIKLKNLPKISLNQWYAGKHWTKRKKIKDEYYLIIKSQCKHVFEKSQAYDVEYSFFFKKNPLDASNCVAMLKMIEDVIFVDDRYNVVNRLSIMSRKSTSDAVHVRVTVTK